MRAYQIFRQSSRAIFRNKGRSFLTILGIIIGIGSVIALISLGNGVKASIGSKISSLGTRNLTVAPGAEIGNATSGNSGGGQQGGFGGGGGSNRFAPAPSTLSVADFTSLASRAKHPRITAVSGSVTGSSIFTINGSPQRQTVTGTSTSYFGIHLLTISGGTLLTDSDIKESRKVAILGHQFAIDALSGDNSVGKTITINNNPYQVVGVLAKADENGFSNPNTMVFIPYTTAMVEFNTPSFSSMTVQARSDSDVDAAKTDVTNTLLANHKISNAKLADFSVVTSKDLLSTINNVTGLLTSLLAGIAAISLVVGGIGIMNIMLVSVTERTREIGLRKAVGAQTADILGQFMAEAIILTVAGGILGIGLGKLIGVAASHALGITPIITPSAVILAVGVSTVVGLVFGIYPAARAARLNPIDALRYE